MRTIETNVYQYDELSDKAKKRARDWWKQFVFSDSSDWEHVYSDAEEIANRLGITFDRKRSGGPDIMFTGFSSQGDGACFEGSYKYAAGALKAVKEYAPKDETLHRIAKDLQDVQRRNFYKLEATCKQSGRYYHAYSMDVEVWRSDDGMDVSQEAEEGITEALRDFANWIYLQLENEYEYQMSDEVVEENILANEYEFDEEGNRA